MAERSVRGGRRHQRSSPPQETLRARPFHSRHASRCSSRRQIRHGQPFLLRSQATSPISSSSSSSANPLLLRLPSSGLPLALSTA
ncbi:unnamed protein product [Brassica oleracea var. botrytis]|uniref:Uncharacterized protein n=1 Tax=Brassica oleracea var. oleracea TaxID=109376 RepID=A0A0D3C6V6_BRAOL